MRLRERETMDAEVERELEALDAALAGDAVPEDPKLAEFVRELHAERPEAQDEFAAELDERAAEGFGRGGSAGPLARLRERVAAQPPRRLVAPVAAAATLLVVVGVAVSQSGIVGDGDPDGDALSVTPAQGPTTGEPGAGAAEAQPPPEAESPQSVEPGDDASSLMLPYTRPGNQRGLVPGQDQRKVERAAQLTLSTEPDDVASVADEVIAVVDGYDGIVVSSQVSGSDDDSVARFDLAIPADKLQLALADLSELADVSARSESTLDITESFVTARERLADAKAELEVLLTQLAEAETPNETRSIRARIDIVRGEIAAARGEVEQLARRARFARVSVTVDSDGGSGGWSLGDAADDAVDVLRTVAGVALVSLAILAPLAIVALIVWLVVRGTARRRRERALD